MKELKLIHGDCIEKLKELPDNSVDSVVTDPPAGIAFMGKEWDKDKGGRKEWIAWMEQVAKECIRVMKPGGHALVWAIPRTSHWTGMAWEDAGWTPRDKIYHAFGSGFPKSLNIGKAVDKIQGNEREITGTRISAFGDSTESETGDGRNLWGKQSTKEVKLDKGNSEWEGWGTALKPAIEEWWLFRKPFKGTVAENVLKHGTGALNIDVSRIGTKPRTPGYKDAGSKMNGSSEWNERYGGGVRREVDTTQGRFPTNFIHDGSDEVLSHFPNTTSGFMKKGTRRLMSDNPNKNTYSKWDSDLVENDTYGDSGSAARFFYCAKASKSDRNEGLANIQPKKLDESRKDGNPGGDNPRNRGVNPERNNHPTVKPTPLMQYLVRLVTPPDGTVLDPFMGSGSTGKACKLEGFGFIGIEMEAEYIEIARARIEAAQLDKPKSKPKKKPNKNAENTLNKFI